MQNDYSSSALQSHAAGFDLVEMHDCFAIAQVGELHWQCTGSAGRRQVDNARLGLAYCKGGTVSGTDGASVSTAGTAWSRGGGHWIGAHSRARLMRAMCASAQRGALKILTITHTRPVQSALASKRDCRVQADRRPAVPVRRTRIMASGRGDRVKGA